MASKRRRSGALTKRSTRRETADFARRSLSRLNTFSSKPVRLQPFPSEGLHLVQDNRLFNFDPLLNARTVSGAKPRVIPAPVRGRTKPTTSRNAFKFLSPRIVIEAPDKTIHCIRRQRRKEVIHALGVAGTKVARPKRNALSNVHCK